MRRLGFTALVLGLAVMVGLGAWWRSNTVPDRTPEARTLTVAPDCDGAQSACIARAEGLEVEVALGPPVRPLESFPVVVRMLEGGSEVTAAPEVQFMMRGMDMGLNRYRLESEGGAVWSGRAVLPVCTSGRTDWVARLYFSAADRHWTAEIPFTTGSH